MDISYLIVSLIVFVFLMGVYFYNSIVRKNKLAEEGWSGIDVQLKRRSDLIPSLVETVKGYASHEKKTLESVIEMRNACMKSTSVAERGENEMALSSMLKSVFALSEAYPDLKADRNFASLQASLADIEEQLQMARRYYNATVRDYNTLIALFPVNLLANGCGFKEKRFFELTNENDRAAPKVSFS